MRIVHANKSYWPHLGGIETVVRDLAEGAAARGHEVSVICTGQPRQTWVGPVLVERARSLLTVKKVPLAPTFPVHLLRHRADVLHVHAPSILPEACVAVLASALKRRYGRLVLSWHSDVVRQQFLLPAIAPLLRRALELADVVLVATPNHIPTSGFLPAVAEKVVVIPFGVDPGRYLLTPPREAAAAALRAKYGPNLTLFLGRLVYYKGVNRLLDAAADLPDANFLLVGRGPLYDQAVESQAARQGRLHVLDPVDHDTKVALLHACDVFVLPSTANSEAYGIVQLEAMACGKPVVTFDLPTGVTWLNQDGRTGLVAKQAEPGSLAEALERLLGDRDLRHRLGGFAQRRATAELDLATQVERTLASYDPP